MMGVNYFLLLGLVAAAAQLIPNIGPFLGAVPALIIAFIASPLLALQVLFVFIVINTFIIAVLAPKILGDKLSIHPITVVLSILIFGEIAGLWGLFLAAPIAASLKIIYLGLKESN
jgi:predicted PurR-regulated permease PerM